MKRLYGLLAMGLIVGLTSGASAHIGEQVYLLFEASEADMADIDLRDADIADWEDVVGDASLVTTDFFQDPTVVTAPSTIGGPRLSHLVGLERQSGHHLDGYGAHRQRVHQRVRGR